MKTKNKGDSMAPLKPRKKTVANRPVSAKEKEACMIALDKFLNHYDGHIPSVCAATGITYAAVTNWMKIGYVGYKACIEIDKNPDVPFTKEKLRPDIKDWKVFAAVNE